MGLAGDSVMCELAAEERVGVNTRPTKTAEESDADSEPFREAALDWSRKVNLPVRPSLIALGSGARRREPDRPLFDVSPFRKTPRDLIAGPIVLPAPHP